MKKYTVLSRKAGHHSDELTIIFHRGWFRKLFKMRCRSIKARGSGTVWHHWPSGRRCTIDEECLLAQEWFVHKELGLI